MNGSDLKLGLHFFMPLQSRVQRDCSTDDDSLETISLITVVFPSDKHMVRVLWTHFRRVDLPTCVHV